MRSTGARTLLALLISAPVVASAQQTPASPVAQPLVVEAETAPGTVSAINGVRAVAGGAVFLNDRANRRVIMLDERLRITKVVIDATPATGALYGQLGARVIAMPGASTMFVDGASRSLVVFDARGNIVRRSAVTSGAELELLLTGAPAFDAQGRLVNRGRGRLPAALRQPTTGAPKQPDTVPILRMAIATGRMDTLAFVRIHLPREESYYVGGMEWIQPVLNPAPTVDEWTLLSDGRLAIVRGSDYHVDFVDASKSLEKGSPIAVVAQRLDSVAKVAVLDSSRAMRARMLAAGLPLGREVAPLPGAVFYSAPGIRVMTSDSGMTVQQGTRKEPVDSSVWVSTDELPDRLPLFLPGGVRADLDGNVWVERLTYPRGGGAVYDVIGPSGRIVARALAPEGAGVVGFAGSDVALLARRDASGLHLVRAHYAPTK